MNQIHLVGKGLEAMFHIAAKNIFNGKFSGYKSVQCVDLRNGWLLVLPALMHAPG